MSTEAIVALTALLTTIGGGIAGFVVKMRLGDVINAGPQRQTYAVETIGQTMQDAVKGLVDMSVEMAKLSQQLKGHEADSNNQYRHLYEELKTTQEIIKLFVNTSNGKAGKLNG